MIKSTVRDLKRASQFESKADLIKFLQDNGLKVVKHEKIAYASGYYGCNGYLVFYTLNNGSTVKAFTGRSTWMYTVDNTHDLGIENYV